MNRPSNLPPGETDDTLGLNDIEYEVNIILSWNEIQTLLRYDYKQSTLPYSERHELWAIASNIVDQISEDGILSNLDEGDLHNDAKIIKRKRKLNDDIS